MRVRRSRVQSPDTLPAPVTLARRGADDAGDVPPQRQARSKDHEPHHVDRGKEGLAQGIDVEPGFEDQHEHGQQSD